MSAAVCLPRAVVPDSRDWWPVLGAWCSTGRCAREQAARVPAGAVIALDTETPSLTDSFTIKCVTAAWEGSQGTETVLLDPLRDERDHEAVRDLIARAGELVLHNSPFDIPGLVAARLMDLVHLTKVTDTLIYARAAWPDTMVRKSLDALGPELIGAPTLKGGLELAIKASGFRSRGDWFAHGDIGLPFYRFNAMADTVITLRLTEPLRRAAQDRQLNHPFHTHGATTRAQASQIVEVPQRANRVTLRRAARGLEVDLDYIDRFRDTVDADIAANTAVLEQAGIRPGNGQDLVTKLDELGLIPPQWPRTAKTGRLAARKDDLKLLGHPLAVAHRAVNDANHTLTYLESVVSRSGFTGRLHPQFAILGASTTGRMSMAEPPLQQFSEGARPIILADPGHEVTSVDWSSIEPAILAWAAGDLEFISPFEQGQDIYRAIQIACGLPLDDKGRKTAKTVLLAQLYGQSLWKMALRIGKTDDEARTIKDAMFAAMPRAADLIDRLKTVAEQHQLVPTMGGRILTVPAFFNEERKRREVASYKAVNFFCQGSNADLIYHVINEAEAQGLGDAIMLPMHDEIVCRTEAGPHIQAIMQTPPDFMAKWTIRQPVIRTDLQEIGSTWLKC